jgi:hypothetical protein
MVDNIVLGQMYLVVLWMSHLSIILSLIHTRWFMYYWCFIILAIDNSALKKHFYWCLKVEHQLCTVKNLLATSLEKSASEQQQLELELSATREKVAEVQSQLLLAEQVGCNWITFNVVSMHSVISNTETLVGTSKDTGLERNAEKPKYIFTSHKQNAGQNINIKDS